MRRDYNTTVVTGDEAVRLIEKLRDEWWTTFSVSILESDLLSRVTALMDGERWADIRYPPRTGTNYLVPQQTMTLIMADYIESKNARS